MRKYLMISTLLLLASTSLPLASNAGVNIGVNIGGPPVYVNPPVVISNAPRFVQPPELGFYVAADVGYDLFLLDNQYYLYSGNVWYRSPYYNGPWVTVRYNHVPYGIRKHRMDRIHFYRDRYYSNYRSGRGHGGYRHYQPKYHEYRRYDHGPGGHPVGPHGGGPVGPHGGGPVGPHGGGHGGPHGGGHGY